MLASARLFLVGLFEITALMIAGGSVPVYADTPTVIKWVQLVPKGVAPVKKPLFGPAPNADGTVDHSSPEGRWLSLKAKQSGAGQPAPVVADWDGKTVSISGYVVPLDYDNTSIKEFLLVPFVGACIHVPPPPANQIIYVNAARGFKVSGEFDPVTVTGTMHASSASLSLADAGYRIDALTVQRISQ